MFLNNWELKLRSENKGERTKPNAAYEWCIIRSKLEFSKGAKYNGLAFLIEKCFDSRCERLIALYGIPEV